MTTLRERVIILEHENKALNDYIVEFRRQLKEMSEKISLLEERVEKRYLSDLTMKEPEKVMPRDILEEYLFGEKDKK